MNINCKVSVAIHNKCGFCETSDRKPAQCIASVLVGCFADAFTCVLVCHCALVYVYPLLCRGTHSPSPVEVLADCAYSIILDHQLEHRPVLLTASASLLCGQYSAKHITNTAMLWHFRCTHFTPANNPQTLLLIWDQDYPDAWCC